MAQCNHCKRWEPERNGACRLCRLCLAISQISGDSGFTPEIYDRTAAQLAEILGNLTSEVLLVPVSERRASALPPPPTRREGGRQKTPETERRGEASDSYRSGHRRKSREERSSRERDRDRRTSRKEAKEEADPSPPRTSRDRRRDRSFSSPASAAKKERSEASPKRVRRAASPAEERRDKISEFPDKSPRESSRLGDKQNPPADWAPQLRPREYPTEPPPTKPRPEVVLKEAAPCASVPEPLVAPRTTTPSVEAGEVTADHSTPSTSYPPVKGKGKGKFGGWPNKGWTKGKAPSVPSWTSPWGWNQSWGWSGPWENSYQGQAKKKNRGQKRDQFIGGKIDERRAKAKAKASGVGTSPAQAEESESSSPEGVASSAKEGELPPEGTVIAEAAPEAAPAVTSPVPPEGAAGDRVERWADATEAAEASSGNPPKAEG